MQDAFDKFTAHPPSNFDHVSAPTQGFVGVFEQLISEHRQAARLIGRLFHEQGKPRAQLWMVVRRNILAHEYAEQHAVYSAFHNLPSLQALLDQHAEDLPTTETLVLQLDALDMNSEEWEFVLNRLEAHINEHVEHEETSLFPRAQDVLGPERCQQLAREYIVCKSSLFQSAQMGAARKRLEPSAD